MANYRQSRVNEELARTIADILRTVKDYRVSGSLVSVTAVDCARDLKNAKVYFSAVGETEWKEVKKGLESAKGYIRREIAQRLNLRITPELLFVMDTSMEHGARITGLLHQVEAELAATEAKRATEEATEE